MRRRERAIKPVGTHAAAVAQRPLRGNLVDADGGDGKVRQRLRLNGHIV